MNMIQVCSLEHAPYEDPVNILHWLDERRISHHAVRLFEGDPLPDPTAVDLLIIMGGPMNIYEEDVYPWLCEEKIFIKKIIDMKKPVLGICLGGQLISSVLGGAVTRLVIPEYGWYTLQNEVRVSSIMKDLDIKTGTEIFPETITVFQWHQDTFQIPPGAIHLYSSETCNNQAFMYNFHVVGLQFHPEMDDRAIRCFLTDARPELEEKGLLHLHDDVISKIDLCSCGREFISGVMTFLISQVHDHEGD